MNIKAALKGLQDGLPIVLGYVPVAMAFGISGSSLGLKASEISLTSLIVYSGAGQFFILAAMKIATPWLMIVALITLLNMRHLFYGPIISTYLPESLRQRLAVAFFLTDEVFATAFHRFKYIKDADRIAWFWGLGVTAWLSWVGGTILGLITGEQLLAHYPLLEQVLKFSLPALFVVLTVISIHRQMLLALIAAAMVSLLVTLSGYPSLAIFAGAMSAFVLYRPKGKRHE
ncbi:Inner membrane protein YgaZ [Oligella ureolytica]|uniref:AzlC family ABC transporter permease n=1 Tax=Oligella ureolytica TaxID=90244 RepID=A0A378XEK2_9BURK|nr:AzlC family ABC transporter permease [Oligella ureolytica]QPT40444.1 AzlC family ABC transporter permease [Oligella ureolytica]SUA51138.1 Inner membrane protein YgaZ [Oligella ureolytica]